jgi:hypothetical protein
VGCHDQNREDEIEAELLNLADRNPDWALAYVILRVAKALEELTYVNGGGDQGR